MSYMRDAKQAVHDSGGAALGIEFYWLALKAIVYALLAIAAAIESATPER